MRVHLDAPTVVGVNGSPDGERAVRYALHRAEMSGGGLLLINAVHEVVPVAPMWPLLTDDSLLDAGRGVLSDAHTLVERLAGVRVPVEVHAEIGPIVPILVEASIHARLVVLGHRGAGTIERVFTGATTIGVAARASCPVVSVPREWNGHLPHQRIIAAIDGSQISRPVLAHAFALADQSSAAVEVVHCWELEPAYSALFADATMAREWRARTSATIQAYVDEWTTLYPGVTVETTLEYADVTRSLVARSAGADVVLVGRHGAGGLGGRMVMSFPGSTARALIQHARCPVELVPLPASGDTDTSTAAATHELTH